MPRDQLVLFAESLEARIPEDHPVRVLDEILDRLDWSDWESEYHGAFGQHRSTRRCSEKCSCLP